MSTIRVASTGTVEERLSRLEQSTNFEEEIFNARLPDTGAVASYAGRWAIPWVDLRKLLPDEKWSIWVAGVIQCANGATLTVSYVNNALATMALGVVNWPVTASAIKFKIGPFPALGPLAPTIPREDIPGYHFNATALGGGTVILLGPTFWLRMSPKST